MNEQTFLTTAELAERWKMSANTLRSWRLRGEGPRYVRPSGGKGKVLYRLEDVIAWEEKHTIGEEV